MPRKGNLGICSPKSFGRSPSFPHSGGAGGFAGRLLPLPFSVLRAFPSGAARALTRSQSQTSARCAALPLRRLLLDLSCPGRHNSSAHCRRSPLTPAALCSKSRYVIPAITSRHRGRSTSPPASPRPLSQSCATTGPSRLRLALKATAIVARLQPRPVRFWPAPFPPRSKQRLAPLPQAKLVPCLAG